MNHRRLGSCRCRLHCQVLWKERQHQKPWHQPRRRQLRHAGRGVGDDSQVLGGLVQRKHGTPLRAIDEEDLVLGTDVDEVDPGRAIEGGGIHRGIRGCSRCCSSLQNATVFLGGCMSVDPASRHFVRVLRGPASDSP